MADSSRVSEGQVDAAAQSVVPRQPTPAPALDAPVWVCVTCRARNAMAADACATCGRPFGEGLAAADRTENTKRNRAVGYVIRELVVLNVLFVLWRIAGHLSLAHASGAFSRGASIWRAERRLHLPSEATLQHEVLGHATLDRALNGYYAWAHALVLAGVLVWLLVRHRDRYARWRNLTVAFTAVSLLIALIPVAPPRLTPITHTVDLAARFHQSVYDGLGKGITDQLSAMPSVHVGWAVIVAAAIISTLRTRWRWLAVGYPMLTTYVVVVTANHYWLDGVAAIAVLGLCAALTRFGTVKSMRALLLLTRP